MESTGSMRRVGRYLLYGELASGGMATVHVGRLVGPVGFSRMIAVKSLHPHLAKNPEFVAMFIDEARLAARIHHPNVVPVLDVVKLPGELFLVMDYINGETLARLIRSARGRGEHVPPAIATSIVAGVLLGLHAAHEATNERGDALEIVHRDVSPQNVMVGVDGVARLVDFGVAKATERVLETTREGQIKGKVAYMAPEQIRGGHVNRQTDVYAASVVLWEALTGERLFAGEGTGQILDRVMLAEVPPPSDKVGGLPAGLDAIVLRGLSYERTARFSTAREMALALEASGLASTTEVGAWVDGQVYEALDDRRRWIAGMESAVLSLGFDDAPVAATGATGDARLEATRAAPAHHARGAVVLAASALAALGVAAWFRVAGGHTEHAVPDIPVVSSANPAPPPPSIDPAATPVQPPTSSVAVAADPPLPTALPKTRAAQAPRSECNPPYTVSPTGRKSYKRNCL